VDTRIEQTAAPGANSRVAVVVVIKFVEKRNDWKGGKHNAKGGEEQGALDYHKMIEGVGARIFPSDPTARSLVRGRTRGM